MLEWLKRHAWKACIRQKRIASSNLAHSAEVLNYGLLKIPQAEMPAGFFALKGSQAILAANGQEPQIISENSFRGFVSRIAACDRIFSEDAFPA